MSHQSWTGRYATEVLFPTCNLSRCQITDHNSLGSSWYRFRRYASWMRQLDLRQGANRWMTDDLFGRLLTGSADGLVCPALRYLACDLKPTNLRFIPHFLSPNLTHLTISVQQAHPDPTRDPLPDLGPTLRILPAPCLQELSIDPGPRGIGHLKDDLDSMIQRCGDSLRVLEIPALFGEAAVHHILRLKNLRVWKYVHSPSPTTLPLSTTVPPLQNLVLSRKETYGWIPWLTQQGRGAVGVYDGPSGCSRLGMTLTYLIFKESAPIDAMFISPFLLLPNLVYLFVDPGCRQSVSCAFSLTDKDVVQLSAALPRLEILKFGPPCVNNTCRTTISCFLALSVHCAYLMVSTIHFNTTNLVNDIQTLSENPDFRDLHSLPTRSSLDIISAGNLRFPEWISDEDITTIATGLIDMLPSLRGILAYAKWEWKRLNSRIRELQAMQSPPLDQT